MAHIPARILYSALCFTLVLGAIFAPRTAIGQIPDDFEVIATAGGWSAFAENRSVSIERDGKVTIGRYLPDAFATDDALVDSLTVSESTLLSIWQALQSHGFFSLEEASSDDEIQDGMFVWLAVIADSDTHEVLIKNTTSSAVDGIVSAINESLPENSRLVYSNVDVEDLPVTDICDRWGKTVEPAIDPGIKPGNDPAQEIAAKLVTDVHPGTVVSHKISLLEAARRGLVRLEGKGGYMGDKVSLSVNNSASSETETVTVDLHLEFRGVGIYAEQSDVNRVVKAIERYWNGKRTSDGKILEVKVHKKIGGFFEGATPGYHQVQMSASFEGKVIGRGQSWDVNRGTGKAVLGTSKDQDVDHMYAHEAGHLMGRPDRYDGYSKQIDNTWKHERTGEVFAATQIAAKLARQNPQTTAKAILERISNPLVKRVSTTQDGYENDIMAVRGGAVSQGNIDAIAASRGLTVAVQPGTILVNKNDGDQNLVVTRNTPLFVKPGETKRINGLWTACIDGHDGVPDIGQRFDVAPPLSEWAGIEAAALLQTLLVHVDSLGIFCDWHMNTQRAIWRITDNSAVGDFDVDTLLLGAGIELGTRTLDFPRMSSPAPDDTTTAALIPLELFLTEIESASSIVDAGTPVDATVSVEGPSGISADATCTWTLHAPGSSGSSIEDLGGGNIRFLPDVRGIYRADVNCQFLSAPGDTTWLPTRSMRVAAADAATDTFERSDLYGDPRFGWTSDPAAPWTVTEVDPHTGTFSAQSESPGDGGSSTLEIRLNLPVVDSIAFAYRTSSETGFDILSFGVDGTSYASWSGELAWNVASFDLPAGLHTLTWTYVKDGSISHGDDRAWIDDVFFPPAAIAVSTSDPPVVAPGRTRLLQNYPNPFRHSTSIPYALAEPGLVTMTLFDVTGRELRRLDLGLVQAGHHRYEIDANSLPGGIYLLRLTSREAISVRSITVQH